ncbi:MAG: family 43 glycosylhydrolase [Bacteroidaceae bacterium]|nr:family 43 glycosylhydrolase [Bacteroidaceae bacterium]
MNRLLLAFVMAFFYWGNVINSQTQVTTSELDNLYKSKTFSTISVHDPSVIFNSQDGKYYIYGSHYIGAVSSDLRNWTAINNYYSKTYDKAFKSSPARKVKRKLNGVVEEVDFPSFDAAAWCATYASNTNTSEADWVKGDQWAPDVVWNPTMNKWCYYVSLNGDFWSSVIVLMTSDNIKGPYTYQGPIVMGGFIGTNTSKDNTKNITPPDYKKSDLEIVMGTQSSLPSKYKKGNNNGNYWPNCIDPCVFFDEEGELWLVYGSWSGGIFMLKLDKDTGLRDYTYTYPNTNAGNTTCTSDEYYGKKIAGGYYVSGEGPYVQHIGNYYYLFLSYGFFSPEGGYEMRVFRSSNPDGPYKDASGVSAIYSDKYYLNYGKNAGTNRGMKLIGAMNHWGNMTVGECAQGHNSVCTDDKGRTFLVCHTKFNNGTAYHQVRSYQLYQNKSGWLVCAPFQFSGETVTDADIASGCPFTTEDIVGDYHFLIHPYKLDHANFEESEPKMITLNANGKITGAYTGTWKMQEGTSYIEIKIGSIIYNGVLVEQTLENNTAKVLAFTAVCNTSGSASCGVPVWGYKLQPASAIAYNYQNYSNTCFKQSNILTVRNNIDIMFSPVENTTLTWTSSNPDVLSNTGKYNPQAESVDLTMTARLDCGNHYWEKQYTSRAYAATAISGNPTEGVVAYYNFDETPTLNLYDKNQQAQYGRSSTKTTVPTLAEDYSRFGKVLHQYFGANGDNSYTRLANPLYGKDNLDAFSVSFWVKRTDSNAYDALFGFFNGTRANEDGARFYMTGNCYVGFNDSKGNWFDVNHPDKKTMGQLGTNEWHLVTLTYSLANGYKIYVDGSAISATTNVWSGSMTEAEFDRSLVMEHIRTSAYLYLGMGSFWGSADVQFDDLLVYDRELTMDDVRGLNTMLNRVNDFSPEAVSIDFVTTDAESASPSSYGIYDLMGRKVSVPRKGMYIVNGKKVIVTK